MTIKSAKQKHEIVAYLADHITAKRADVAVLLGVKSTRVKQLLKELQSEGIVAAERSNRDRFFRLKP